MLIDPLEIEAGATRITVNQAFELLWKLHLSGKPSARSYLSNRKAIIRSFGHKYLDEVTFLDVESHKQSRSHTPCAAFHDHGLISLLFNKMADWKRRRLKTPNFDFGGLSLPYEVPTLGIKKKRTRPRRVRISPDQFALLIEHATDRLRDSMILALDLGMAACDLDRMTPEWFNQSTGKVEWTRAKTGVFVAVPPTARSLRIIQRAGKGELVVDATNRRKEFEQARKAANLEHLQFRDIRKTTVNEAVESRGRIEDGQFIAGHSSPRTTTDYYRIADTWDLKKVVNFIARRFPTKKIFFHRRNVVGKIAC